MSLYLISKMRLVTIVAVILLSSFITRSQDISTYANYKPEELLKIIVNSTSRTEKIIVAGYLAKTYPITIEGEFAKALVVDYEKPGDDNTALFKKCLSLNPNFLPALFKLGEMLKGKEGIEFHEKVLNLDPSWNNYESLFQIYLKYTLTIKDKSAAEAFLAGWETKQPNLYKIDLIRGYSAHSDRDYKKAEEFYLKAIGKNPADFEAYKLLLKMKLSMLEAKDGVVGVNTSLNLIINYLNKNPNSSEANFFFGEVLSYLRNIQDQFESLKDIKNSAEYYYIKGYENNRTAENAVRVYNLKLSDTDAESSLQQILKTQNDAYNFLLQANKELPNNQLLLFNLASHASEKLGDIGAATNFYQQAIKYSYTTKDEIYNAKYLAFDVYEGLTFEYDKAKDIYLSYLSKGNKGDLLYDLFINQRNARNFKNSSTYLAELEQYSREILKDNINESVFLDRRSQIEKYTLAEKQAEEFYKENPFHQEWQNDFGESLKLPINFAPGSAEIPKSDLQYLAEIATRLRTKGNRYIFSIEGHSDKTETDKSIAERRAESVMSYFETSGNISRDRMRVVGYKANIPLASNDTAEGRAKNRRVEIVPLGKISKPTIFPTAALNVDQTIALSPEGRTIAVGNSPIQLWDVERTIKLKDLGRGGRDLKFSPNGRYLATAINFSEIGGGKTYALLVYDIKTGITIDQMPSDVEISNFDWDPTSKKIVFTTAYAEGSGNKIIIRNIREKKNIKLKMSKGLTFNGGDEVLWSKDNKYIVAARPWSKEIQLFESENLTLIKELEGVDYPHALAQTIDYRYIICSDNSRKLSVWDTNDWSLKQMKISTLTNQISVHPQKNIIALNDFAGGGDARKGNNHSIVVDLDKFAVVGERAVGPIQVRSVFSADGSKIYLALKDKIEVIDAASSVLKNLSEITGPSNRAIDSSTDTLNNYYISVDKSDIHVWSINTGNQVKSWNESVEIFTRFGSDKDNFLFTTEDEANKTTKVNLLNTSRFEKKEILNLKYKVDSVVVNSQFIAFAGKEYTPMFFGNVDGFIEVYDRSTLKFLRSLKVPLVTDNLEYDGIYDSGFSGFDINAAGDEAVITTYWQDGLGHALIYSDLARIYNLNNKDDHKIYTLSSKNETVPVMDVAYNEGNSDQIKIIMRSKTAIADKNTRKIISWNSQRKNEYKIHLTKTNSDILWSTDYLRVSSPGKAVKQLDFFNNLVGVEVFEDKNLLLTINRSNEISLYNLISLEKALTILPKINKEWIAYSPSGYFVSSLNGADKVFWSLGDSYLEFSTLLATYEKPPIISETLDSIEKGIIKNEIPTGPKPATYVPPYKMARMSDSDFATEEAIYTMQVKVEPDKNNLPLPKVRFINNGKDFGSEGAKRRKVGDYWVISWDFTLQSGTNFIEAELDYEGTQGIQHSKAIVHQNPSLKVAAPNLWFVGIGVKKEPLQYTTADVNCIAKAFKQQEGHSYDKVNIKIFTDEQAKYNVVENKVTSQIESFLKDAAPTDIIVVYISGHGVLDDEGLLFFVPYDGEMKNPSSNLPMAYLGAYFGAKSKNQRVVILLDICHAGTFKPGVEENILQQNLDRLVRGTGLYILAATSGTKTALESSKYKGGHGAFAAAIIEVLEGSTDKKVGFTTNDFFSVTNLANYVIDRVYNMTDGAQQPTPAQLGFSDYRKFSKRRTFDACLNP